ncbi:MAG: hypothetical protein ACLTEH_03265 [Clostridia bacterium]
MKKKLKMLLITLGILIALSFLFWVMDYARVQKKEKPIFCINIATYRDGGTKEYYGLGYKVIVFNKILESSQDTYYKDVKIGTWFMKYEDFEAEYNLKSVEVTGIDIENSKLIQNEKARELVNILEELQYKEELCSGIARYTVKCDNGVIYYIKSDCNGVVKNGKQANISKDILQKIESIIEDNSSINKKDETEEQNHKANIQIPLNR